MTEDNSKDYKYPSIEKEHLKNREIFIFEDINETLSKKVIQQLLYLDSVSHKDITIWINSPGGSVDDGFAIIDIMKKIKSNITTIIIGNVCSMAGHISINGDKRLITKNSTWMAHDMSGGITGDYTTKVLDRTKNLEVTQKKLHYNLKKNTKLSRNELDKAKHGELWLESKECKLKGIVDEII
jgi:ATP-dependent Clp protease protease subunit